MIREFLGFWDFATRGLGQMSEEEVIPAAVVTVGSWHFLFRQGLQQQYLLGSF
jgi:hypothetical protein